MATEIKEYSEYEIATIDQSSLREIFDENQGAEETIGPSDLPRITLPSGKVSVWELPSIQGPVHADSFEGILVSWKKNRAYWPNKYSGQGESPDCRSHDGLVGIGKPGGVCSECPLSKWDDGNAPACTDQRVLFIVRENNILPLVMVLPPTSIPPMRKLMLNLTNEKLTHWAVVIRFGLEKDKSAGGIEFSKLKPSVVRILNPEEQKRVKSYVYLIKGLVSKTHAGPEDNIQNINNETQDSPEIAEVDNMPEPPDEESELNSSLMKEEPLAKKGNGKEKEEDEFTVMDKFLKDKTPNWPFFWVSCKLLGFEKAEVHAILKTDSVKDIPKDRLNVFLRSEYARKIGEPRL